MKTKARGTLTVIAIAVAGALAFLLFRAVPVEAAYPAERAKVSFMRKVMTRVRGLWRGSQAMAENVVLRREVASLAMERGEYSRVLAENARLRKALAFTESVPGRWVAAEVLSHGGGAAGARRILRAGKGSLAGVAEGAVVEVPEGLVGRVVSVTPHTCEVLLVTDPALKVSCRVEGTPPVLGVLSGGNDDALVIRHLKAGVEIPPRTAVYTSGLGGVFPAGIAVGTFCTEGESSGDASGRGSGGLERDGKVLPAVDFSTLEDVFIRK